MPVAAIVGSVITGGLGYLGARQAANAQMNAADKASALQKYYFDMTRGDLAKYRNVGGGALTSLGALYGIGPDGKPTGKPFPQASLDAFNKSPDYQYALQEGLKSVEQSRAARGSLHSGGTMEELQAKGSGIASQNFGNYVSRLLQLAGIGESAAAQTGSAAMSTGRGLADTAMARGESQASGIVGGYNALSGAFGDITNNLSLYGGGSKSAYGATGGFGQGGLW